MGDDSRGDQRQRRRNGPASAQPTDDRSGRKEALLTPWTLLWRDERFVAVRKSSGIHVHPTRLDPGEPSLLELVSQSLGCPLFPVHRLDRPTSGAVVFAADREAASFLGAAFREHRVGKVYQALVRGWMPPSDAQFPVKRDRRESQYLDAQTTFRPLALYEPPWPRRGFPTFRLSLVEARPVTGRRHQIRQHCDDLRHPILGDTVWGDTALNGWLAKLWLESERPWLGLHLWCRTLTFPHPNKQEMTTVTAPLGADEIRELSWLESYRVTVPEL